VFAGASAFSASDPRPVVGPGATKDDVINAYGWPNGQSQSGTREILNYSQGDVYLENGRVERVNFSPNVPWQTPRPRPGPPTASTRKLPEVPVDFWVTDFTVAQQEAKRRNCRILALFTGSDWSPASKEFHDQVEFNPDFVNAFTGDFVFLKLDYPRGGPVPAKISEENLRLRDKYAVTVYPTILILSAAGDTLGRADLSRGAPNTSFRDRVIVAVREVRDTTGSGTTPAPATTTPTNAPTAATKSSAKSNESAGSPAAPGLLGAGQLVIVALIAGAAIVGFVLWRMWRQPKGAGLVIPADMAGRIDAAAGGLPSATEIGAWSHDKLCAVTAALAEFDGYAAHLRPTGGDVDIELRKRGDVNPRVLVCCAAGAAGTVSVKRVRELFGSCAAEGAESGWFVGPAGFANDAREYAASHKIALIGSDGLQNMMREIPPVSLPCVLTAGDR
jgi:hypothetical protein